MNKKIGLWLVLVLCVVLVTGCGKKEETPVDTDKVETEAETPVADDRQETEDTADTDGVEDTTEDTGNKEENTEVQKPSEDTQTPEEETEEQPEENMQAPVEKTEEQPEENVKAPVEKTEEQPEENVKAPVEEEKESEVEQPEVQEPVEDTQTPEEQPEPETPATGNVVLTDIFEAVKNSYEYFAADMLMNASNPDELAMIDMMVWVSNENGDGVGLNPELYDEYVAAVPMIGFNPDIFLAVKAKDGKLNDVVAFMESLKAQKVDPMNNYPSNLPRQQAIRIETYGNYVFFYTVGMPNDTETDEAALLEYYKEQNQIASDVIAGFFK